MLKAIIAWYNGAQNALKNNVAFNKIMEMQSIEKIGRMKYIFEDDFEAEYHKIISELNEEFEKLEKGENA